MVKTTQPDEVYHGPAVRDGEHVFGVAHIYASFNDTFVVCDIDALSSRRQLLTEIL